MPAESPAVSASRVAAPAPSDRSQRGLDALNFFIADVETAFGPFISVYLASYGWNQSAIGEVLTINTAIALATQTPAGALVDWIARKRLVVVACLMLIVGGALLIALLPTFLPVAAGEMMHGLTGGALRTALTAIGLGLVGHRAFHTRVGRNHRYDSLGNAATAAAMGVLGAYISPRAPFLAAAGLCLPGFLALGLINGKEVDYARARGAAKDKGSAHAKWHRIARNKPLLIFAFCLFLFQFSNASLLPLAGERLAADYRHESELVISALVVVPQVVTAIIAGWVARKADEWGRKWLLLAAFVALLALAVLFAVTINPWFMVGWELLGGVTAAVIGIINPLVVADLTAGTGRYNFSLGAVSMIAGIGATVSTTATGFIAQIFGYTIGFLVLAAVAGIGLVAVWRLVPETVEAARKS
ncbi:MAG: MFS transporter [Acetobacteraceae bacterium]